MIDVGKYALWGAFFFSLVSVCFLALGVIYDRRDYLRNGYYAIYAFFLAALVASVVLLQAFLRGDFNFAYVLENSDASLSMFYRVAGFWAGAQGSFLLWLLLLAIVTVVIALLDLNRAERLTGGAVMVLALISAVFAALMVFDSGSNPFLKAEAGLVPSGLNPLLLHPGMVLHPPSLFIGYVGMAVPFAFAVSALLLGRGDKLWVQRSQKWAVGGWLFLTLGIGLGAWWAYVVLSFGGYWGWDPVENTSLVPWLTATALLHSFTLYRARGLFKHWALVLAALTFFFTILATWTTRTGLINSVHAFEKNDLLVNILTTFLVVVIVASAGLIIWRWRRFESHEEIESLLSREFLYYVTNLLLTLFAIAVAFATVAVPLISGGWSFRLFGVLRLTFPSFSWFPGSVGPDAYNKIAQPFGVLVLALVAICPLLAWRVTDGVKLRKTLILPLVTMAVSAVLWVYLGFQSNVWGFIGLLVCGFAFGAVIQFVLRAAAKAAGPGKPLTAGLGRAFTGSRSRTGAYFVHMGMVLVVAGLIGSNIYKVETSTLLTAKPGETATVGDYKLTFKGIRVGSGPQNSRSSSAVLAVSDHGKAAGTLLPITDIWYNGTPDKNAIIPDESKPKNVGKTKNIAVRAVILGGWKHDLFVVTDDPFDKTSGVISLRMVIFPLVRFVWAGSILLCVGAVVSLWPKGRRKRAQRVAAGARRDVPADDDRYDVDDVDATDADATDASPAAADSAADGATA